VRDWPYSTLFNPIQPITPGTTVCDEAAWTDLAAHGRELHGDHGLRPGERLLPLPVCVSERVLVVELPWAADSCPCVEKLRTVLLGLRGRGGAPGVAAATVRLAPRAARHRVPMPEFGADDDADEML
jgi:hypothetical protein